MLQPRRALALPDLPVSLLVCLWILAGCAPAMPADPGEAARHYAARGDTVDALREVEIALRRRPEDAALLLLAAELHGRQGQLERAAAAALKATRAAPEDPRTWLVQGSLAERRGDADTAYVAYRRARRLRPEDPGVLRAFARAAERAGIHDEAREARDALRPADEDPWNERRGR